MNAPSKQCAKCPWKVTTDPCAIPNGYSVAKHKALRGTIAKEGTFDLSALRLMACHETGGRRVRPCVGWLANQLGTGNNIALRLAVATGRVSADFVLDGEQHESFARTLPRKRGAK